MTWVHFSGQTPRRGGFALGGTRSQGHFRATVGESQCHTLLGFRTSLRASYLRRVYADTPLTPQFSSFSPPHHRTQRYPIQVDARRFRWRGGGVYRVNGHIAVCPACAAILCLASLCAGRGAQPEGASTGARSAQDTSRDATAAECRWP